MRRLALVGFAVALVAPTPGLAGMEPPILPRGVNTCGLVAGAPWTSGDRHGTHWSVEAKNLPCTLARNWVPRLTKTRLRPLPAPPGFTCAWRVKPTPRHGGQCTNGANAFYWTIATVTPTHN